eukprot:1299225-Prymnesium_polylepis.1
MGAGGGMCWRLALTSTCSASSVSSSTAQQLSIARSSARRCAELTRSDEQSAMNDATLARAVDGTSSSVASRASPNASLIVGNDRTNRVTARSG